MIWLADKIILTFTCYSLKRLAVILKKYCHSLLFNYILTVRIIVMALMKYQFRSGSSPMSVLEVLLFVTCLCVACNAASIHAKRMASHGRQQAMQENELKLELGTEATQHHKRQDVVKFPSELQTVLSSRDNQNFSEVSSHLPARLYRQTEMSSSEVQELQAEGATIIAAVDEIATIDNSHSTNLPNMDSNVRSLDNKKRSRGRTFAFK